MQKNPFLEAKISCPSIFVRPKFQRTSYPLLSINFPISKGQHNNQDVTDICHLEKILGGRGGISVTKLRNVLFSWV